MLCNSRLTRQNGRVGCRLKHSWKRMGSLLLDLFDKKVGDMWECVLTEFFVLRVKTCSTSSKAKNIFRTNHLCCKHYQLL